MYRANFFGSSDIKIYSIRQLQRVLRDTKRNKYRSAVKCGTAGKRKCGKVRYCGVKGYAVKCGTAGQGVKGISHPVFYGDLVYKLRRVKDTPNFISSGSKIVKRLRRRQYDPLIIETTIGIVLGPCTALCRLFLKHCTLTNKAVGTI